ncbi:hypothetical protein LSAT2_000899, partial [Lamellibrachia satsuma]
MPNQLTTRMMVNVFTFYLQVTIFNTSVKAYKPKKPYEAFTPAPRRPTDGKSQYAEQRLLHHLLRDYDPDARGVEDAQTTVRITIDLLLLRIQSLVGDDVGVVWQSCLVGVFVVWD